MRTTVEVDDALLEEAQHLSGLPTKAAVAEAGLRQLIRNSRRLSPDTPALDAADQTKSTAILRLLRKSALRMPFSRSDEEIDAAIRDLRRDD
ncbi:type II toxin-antitoxin system VapB family antitoxin [Pseudomonas sp. R2.Fl]|nr:type II toxin-antitoxin system VapB family antitoxin [Pseudomonas sp. R2.Fl]